MFPGCSCRVDARAGIRLSAAETYGKPSGSKVFEQRVLSVQVQNHFLNVTLGKKVIVASTLQLHCGLI